LNESLNCFFVGAGRVSAICFNEGGVKVEVCRFVHAHVVPFCTPPSSGGLLRGGEWEYDYSYTTPERPESINVPCQDLVKCLGLAWDRQRGWVDGNGHLVAFETRAKRRNGLFVRRDALNEYIATTQRMLVYRRFANRGLFSQSGRDGSQMDFFTWMTYHPTDVPRVLNETDRPFNC
jgi:hypothetical protein